MPEDPNSIVIKDVKFSYDIAEEDSEKAPRLALDGISVTIEKGSYTAILGSNGSGKSTLAKIIDILEVPDSGKVVIFGYFRSFDPGLFKHRCKSCDK